VGAGAAPWSLALAGRDPACQVTAIDWPGVLVVTRRAAAAAGCASQFTFLAGDFFVLDWGQAAYDLALAGNICHLFDEAANRRLLGRLFAALRPGGRVAILDVLPNEHLDGPRPVVLYALGLLLRTTRGGIYPFSDYAGWLRDAGYESIERVDVSDAPPVSLIVACRP
jgi:SAM-dependent methyltransferase